MLTPTLTSRNIIIAFVVWWLCWIALQTVMLEFTLSFPWKVAFMDAVITNAILAFAGYDMIMVTRYYQPRPALRVIISIALTALFISIMRWLLVNLVDGGEAYNNFVDRSLFIRGLFAWLMISLVTTMSWMWFYIREQQEHENRTKDTEKLAREAELATLRQQLQPHFLFNSLNSISALIGARPEEARRMTQQLSDFLRGTIRRGDLQLISLQDELTHLHLYLEIEKVRFGHRLRTEVIHDEESLQGKLPSLLLQPIVENAIKFGLYDTTGEITISLNATTREGYLTITVQNPFDPATATPKQGTGFGLSAVQRRLYLLYARQDLLTTRQQNSLFTTEVKVPQG